MAIRTVTQGCLNDIQEVSFEDGIQVITVRFDNGIDVSQTWKWGIITHEGIDSNSQCLHDLLWKQMAALSPDECFTMLGKVAKLTDGISVTPFDGEALVTNGGTMAEDLPVKHPEED